MNRPVFEHPPWIYVFIDGKNESSAGHIRIREGEDGRPGACVLALRGGAVAMVEVYRPPLAQYMWEIPRGYSDLGESSVAAARRELREETGVNADAASFESLGPIAPNSGLLESIVELFFVSIPPEVELEPSDQEEVRRVQWIPTAALLSRIREGDIVDGFTLGAVSRALLKGLISIEPS